jgi:O-methyltransferase
MDHSQVRHSLFARAMDELWRPRPAETFVPLGAKEGLYDIAAKMIGNGAVTYLEFGVHKGWSFERVLSRFTDPAARFYGFDSFDGLPEKWGHPTDHGHFSTGGQAPKLSDPRVDFVKGWFQNTLPDFLTTHPITAPVLVHFDADLYSTTLFLLTTLWHHIPEYWFLFDEFPPDEIVAMHDFTRAYPVEFEFVACTQDEHARPHQVFGRLQKVPFKVPDQPSPAPQT